jgi:rare lipoprotein A
MGFRFLAVLAAVVFVLSPAARAFAPTRHRAPEIQHGTASWYGAEQGRHTSSGERFDPDALTAAHRHLPFNTIIHVTNCNNGRTVDVRINDRGPWKGGRILDLSSAAADVLHMKRDGIVPVDIEIVRLGSPGRHHAE